MSDYVNEYKKPPPHFLVFLDLKYELIKLKVTEFIVIKT